MSYTSLRKLQLHNYDDNILILQVFFRRQQALEDEQRQADKEEMEGENEKGTLQRQVHFCSGGFALSADLLFQSAQRSKAINQVGV